MPHDKYGLICGCNHRLGQIRKPWEKSVIGEGRRIELQSKSIVHSKENGYKSEQGSEVIHEYGSNNLGVNGLKRNIRALIEINLESN